MSYVLNTANNISSGISKGLKNSIIIIKTDKLSRFLEKAFEKSFISHLITWFFTKLRESSIGNWFLTPEEEVDVFESSKTMHYGVDVVETGVEKGRKYSSHSLGLNILMELFDYFSKYPVFVISLVVFSAAVTNTLLWLFLKEFDFFSLVIRLLVVLISALGLAGRNVTTRKD